MNKREKRNIKKNYLRKINNILERTDKDEDQQTIELLHELNHYVKTCSVNLFYDIYKARKWPDLRRRYTKWSNTKNILNDTELKREITLSELGID